VSTTNFPTPDVALGRRPWGVLLQVHEHRHDESSGHFVCVQRIECDERKKRSWMNKPGLRTQNQRAGRQKRREWPASNLIPGLNAPSPGGEEFPIHLRSGERRKKERRRPVRGGHRAATHRWTAPTNPGINTNNSSNNLPRTKARAA
jgi:hypothetical protein